MNKKEERIRINRIGTKAERLARSITKLADYVGVRMVLFKMDPKAILPGKKAKIDVK